MPKRGNNTKNSARKSKIRKIEASSEVMENNVNLPNLPLEVIIQIISNLTDVRDIKNCMKLSKDVNSFIYRTPEIMKKIKFNFNCPRKSTNPHLNFLKLKGKYIKNMKTTFDFEDTKTMRTILIQTPNLTGISFKIVNPLLKSKTCLTMQRTMSLLFSSIEYRIIDFEECWTPRHDSVALPQLKTLEIEATGLYNFLKVTQQVKTLEKLIIYMHGTKHQRVVTEFIMQQENLKELTIKVTGRFEEFNFPSEPVKSGLKKLKIFTNGERIYRSFNRILETQSSSLEELEIDFPAHESTMKIICDNFKKLRIFKRTYDGISGIRYLEQRWKSMDEMTHYEDMIGAGLNLIKYSILFPNLKSLKCSFLTKIDGRYDIQDLSVRYCKISNLKYVRLENLKDFRIERLMEVKSEDRWLKFVENIKNIKSLKIDDFENILNLPIILKSLKIFKNNPKFIFRSCLGFRQRFENEDNEEVPTNKAFYKVIVDMDQKTVKVSSFIVKKNKKELKMLIDIFKDFDFFEFCFNNIAMKNIDVKDFEALNCDEMTKC